MLTIYILFKITDKNRKLFRIYNGGFIYWKSSDSFTEKSSNVIKKCSFLVFLILKHYIAKHKKITLRVLLIATFI